MTAEKINMAEFIKQKNEEHTLRQANTIKEKAIVFKLHYTDYKLKLYYSGKIWNVDITDEDELIYFEDLCFPAYKEALDFYNKCLQTLDRENIWYRNAIND